MKTSTMPKRQEIDRNTSILLATTLLAHLRNHQTSPPFSPHLYYESVNALAIAVAGALDATIKDEPSIREWFDAALDSALAELAAQAVRRGGWR